MSNQMPPEEVFSRTLFGLILIITSFLSWGKWVALTIGFLFVVSGVLGVCWPCVLYKKFISKKSGCCQDK